jgi:hypothetical protein
MYSDSVSKVDLYKFHKAEYAEPKSPALIDCKPAQYLAIKGRGKPGGAEFEAAVGALYNVAFTVKMAKKRAGHDYAVCKLEGLWPSLTEWTVVIRTPDFVTAEDLRDAIATLKAKGKPAEVASVKLEKIEEGRSVQVLHVGAYSEEAATIEAMRTFAESQKLRFHGTHHEIYLSDPRKVAPAKLKTILRQPVR